MTQNDGLYVLVITGHHGSRVNHAASKEPAAVGLTGDSRGACRRARKDVGVQAGRSAALRVDARRVDAHLHRFVTTARVR